MGCTELLWDKRSLSVSLGAFMDDRVGRRGGYALTLPDALLHSEAMRRACAARDFQEIFRLVNRRTGSSYSVIASVVGNMTSSRVSDIIRGVCGIRGQAVIERVADGFGIPGEMLGLPQRSWESPNSATTHPSRPEGPVNSTSVTLPKMDASRVEAATEHLREMWHSLVRADNLFGPRHALTSVHQQLSILESMLEHARGGQRIGLLRLAAQYAESAAWLHEDTADMPNAVKWTSRAMEWATESGDQFMVMWTLFRKSQQATTRKNPAQTISLAQAVQRNESVLTPSVRAAAMQQEAHGYALDGDERSCHRRLDEAREFAASPDTRGDAKSGHGDFCTASYIEIQRANCWITLGRLDLAVPIFEAALNELPDAYQRDRGLAQSRLALAYTGVQEYDQAAAQAASALSIARASGSMRTMRETVTAANALGRVHTSQAVTELFDAIEEGTGF
ncbi:XRE family transcriptional regulator [Streptomyces acidiscabies]|uniref:XRE family transcriptional regulator n=1 Tax=Streptomyces acidiscabies TaxID=42234 RepID=UPI0030D4BFFF